jgi:hypothetical protein
MKPITQGGTKSVPQITRVSAPTHSYWVYTEKGSRLHHAQPGAVVSGDPYSVPQQWVNDGLVTIEELE